MRKSIALCWLVAIASFGVHAQNAQLDSLIDFVDRYKRADTIKANALNRLSEQYQWSNFDRALQFAELARTISDSLNYIPGIATAQYLKGHCYWALGDSEIAIEMGMAAIALGEQIKSGDILVEAYQVLARAYMDQATAGQAVRYINLAEELAQKNRNWDQLSRVYNLAGVIQFVEGRTDSALLLYEKALAMAEEFHTPRVNSARILSNIGECHLNTDPKLAFRYFDQALALARETGNRTAEASISAIAGNALVRLKGFDKAEVYLLEALRLSRQLGLKRVTRHAYSGLSNLKGQQGKTAEALAYMKSFYEVRDSLLNASKTRQIVELESRHELEKKEQAIRLLEQETRIQAIWRNLLITALALTVLAAVLTYYLLAYRENKNREILNLEIDYLTSQHKEISETNKNLLLGGNEKTIESQDQRLLKAVIEVVEKNISDPLFGVEKMASELGMSRTNLHRKVKAVTGFPPSELIRSIRLRRAAVLLLNQADTVSQIGIRVGFDDHSYFSKSFKKQYGVPPSEYLASVSQTDRIVQS